MDVVRVSAPAKVILHGEHSVVYGKTALACSLDIRTTASIKPAVNKKLVSMLKKLFFVVEDKNGFPASSLTVKPGNAKGGRITVPLTSCLTGFELAV